MAFSKDIKALFVQFTKYFGVALVGYVFDFGFLILLTSVFHAYYLIGTMVGFIAGLIVVYILSGKYVFGESKIKSKRAEFLLFAAIGLIGLGLLSGIMLVLTSGLHIHYVISKILATIVVYAWNFGARKSMYRNQSHASIPLE